MNKAKIKQKCDDLLLGSGCFKLYHKITPMHPSLLFQCVVMDLLILTSLYLVSSLSSLLTQRSSLMRAKSRSVSWGQMPISRARLDNKGRARSSRSLILTLLLSKCCDLGARLKGYIPVSWGRLTLRLRNCIFLMANINFILMHQHYFLKRRKGSLYLSTGFKKSIRTI